MNRSFTTRKLALQPLETRQLLAGNVDVFVSGGDLTLRGDDAANGVELEQVRNNQGAPILGSYRLTGLFQGGAATTINGQASVVVAGVNDDVLVDLRRGNDRFQTGAGRHLFADDLTVNLGEGNNTAALNGISVRDDVAITSGSGFDNVSVTGVVGNTAANSDADLTINTGSGSDSVTLRNFFVRDDADIDTGFGNFTDAVNVLVGNVGDDMNIRTREGSDFVNMLLTGVNDDLLIDTGSGNDRVGIRDSEADELFAFLGSDNDRLDLNNSLFRRATLSGGSGVDQVFGAGNTFTEFFNASSF